MELFNVYPIQDVIIEKAENCYVYDDKNTKYLDFYGGHAVISIGHNNPHFVKRINNQLEKIVFYSNSVRIPIQKELADKLGEISGYDDYQLFLVNSGAEANENAIKLASFITKKDHVIAFKNSFHGRTSGAVAITDNPKIVSPFNANHNVTFCDYDIYKIEKILQEKPTAAIIYEPIQGVGNVIMPSDDFVQNLEKLCKIYNIILIADEIQCGYARSGKFFAHQHSNIKPDIITIAKGMGNGFPVGGILINPNIKPEYGMLGTTFGGNHISCAACLAVLEEIENQNLIKNAEKIGTYIREGLKEISQIKEIRGKGLMIGLKFDFNIKELKDKLLFEKHIFVGNSSDLTVLRLLPSLTIQKEQTDYLIKSLKELL